MAKRPLSLYRSAGLAAAVVFAAVGVCFFLVPDRILGLFNQLSGPLGFAAAPAAPSPFYVALAAAYMFVVTMLALNMYRRPDNPLYASILAQAKFASSALSLILFFSAGRFLILLVNGLVDGFIGLAAAWLAGWGGRKDA